MGRSTQQKYSLPLPLPLLPFILASFSSQLPSSLPSSPSLFLSAPFFPSFCQLLRLSKIQILPCFTSTGNATKRWPPCGTWRPAEIQPSLPSTSPSFSPSLHPCFLFFTTSFSLLFFLSFSLAFFSLFHLFFNSFVFLKFESYLV